MSVVEHVRLGFNYRMPELSAALGVAQLERLDQLLGNRKRVASQYAEHLGGIGAAPAGEGDPEGLLLPCRDRGAERRSWFVFPVQLPRGSDLQAVVEALAERGVQARAYLPCVHLMPHVRERFGLREGMLPVAEDVARRSLALPFHGRMREGEVARVAEALRAALS